MIKTFLKKILPKRIIECLQKKKHFYYFFILILYRIKRLIFPPKLPINSDGKILLHLGCGAQKDKRFINIDAAPYPNVHYVQGVEELKIFPNKYADLIYVSHVLEHVSHRELINVLKEWRRVLKCGGILRISVPDFDQIIDIYGQEKRNIDKIKDPLMGGQDSKYNFHKSVFNEDYLTKLLLQANFCQARRWSPKNDEYYSFNDWAGKYIDGKYPISLNIEAVK